MVFFLSFAETLYLNSNEFTGGLEPIGELTSLKEFDAHGNSFVGTLPADLFQNMKRLEVLRLSSNRFQGSIPPSLGSCSNLRDVMLEDNQMTGQIPVELGDLRILKRLTIQKNQIIGTMPSHVCDLTNIRLTYLAADCERPSPKVFCSCCDQCF